MNMKLMAVLVVGFIHIITADRSGSLPHVNGELRNEASTFPPLIHEIASANPITILRYNNNNGADGSYQFDYETQNKIFRSEVGYVKNLNTNQEATVARGSYSYIAPNGEKVTVNYIADENGFQPVGSHIPSPPLQPVTREYDSAKY